VENNSDEIYAEITLMPDTTVSENLVFFSFIFSQLYFSPIISHWFSDFFWFC